VITLPTTPLPLARAVNSTTVNQYPIHIKHHTVNELTMILSHSSITTCDDSSGAETNTPFGHRQSTELACHFCVVIEVSINRDIHKFLMSKVSSKVSSLQGQVLTLMSSLRSKRASRKCQISDLSRDSSPKSLT